MPTGQWNLNKSFPLIRGMDQFSFQIPTTKDEYKLKQNRY